MSWDTKFSEPIPVAGRMPLITLRDAATYITTLSKADQAETRWQNAVHVLMQAADNGGPIEFARLGMAQALHPREPVYDTSRKDPHWGRRKLARDR
jgi:hypothetical protein